MPSIIKSKGYNSLLLKQNEHRFYFTTIPVNELFPYCFVSRREGDDKKGFQRNLNRSRAEDIALYLGKSKGSIPTNIVLSAQSSAGMKYISNSKLIQFRQKTGAFLVLDGQHRLWGYSICVEKFGKNLRVPVSIYENLTPAEEVQLFIDINTTQRGVPAALLLDIQHLAEMEKTQDRVLRELFDKLSSDPGSPMNGKMSPSKSVVGRISRVTFKNAFAPVLRSSIFTSMSAEGRYKIIRNYLKAIELELKDKSLLTKSVYFEAIFEVFDELVRTTKTTFGDVKLPNLQRKVAEIVRLNLYAPADGKTKVSKAALADAMKAILRKSVAINEDEL